MSNEVATDHLTSLIKELENRLCKNGLFEDISIRTLESDVVKSYILFGNETDKKGNIDESIYIDILPDGSFLIFSQDIFYACTNKDELVALESIVARSLTSLKSNEPLKLNMHGIISAQTKVSNIDCLIDLIAEYRVFTKFYVSYIIDKNIIGT